MDQLSASFGKVKEEAFDFEQIRKYHDRKDHKESFQVLSDKTCNDLDFEELFQFLDRTTSKIGQQYLYHRLKTLTGHNDELQRQEALVERFQNNEALRLKAQYHLRALSDHDALFISGLFQRPALERPKWFFVVPLLAATNLIVLLLSFVLPQYLLVVLGVTVINLVIHYWNKWKAFEFLTSIPMLLRMFTVAQRLEADIDFNRSAQLSKALQCMNRVRRWMLVFHLETGVQDDLKGAVAALLELVKIVFLLDPLALFGSLRHIEERKEEIEQVFEYVGQMDSAIAIASIRKGVSTYCRPHIKDAGKTLEVKNGMHPLIVDCVSNSIELDHQSLLLTGSNMSGKTTFIRTIGVNVLTALTINTCFAESFSMPRMRLWSAVRISDDLLNDRSYYFEEVLTVKEMIAQCDNKVPNLFLLDEIFKGTNTVERISGGKAVLSHLNKGDNLVMVSTHDIELTDLLQGEFQLNHFTEQVMGQEIVFDYQLKPGPLTTRNAIRILELNNYPASVVDEARMLADGFGINQEVLV